MLQKNPLWGSTYITGSVLSLWG